MQFKLLKNKDKTSNNAIFKSQKSYKKTQEKSRGRSMVEMLGVLAIIGVLSIGGIQGYTLAMRKYRANEIISFATKYASVIYTGFYNQMSNNGATILRPEEVDQEYFGSSDIPAYYCEDEHGHYRPSSCFNSDSNDGVKNLGLGSIPSGIRKIYALAILPAFDDFPHERVNITIKLTDKELCQTVATLLSGFYSSSDGNDSNDGTYCDGQFNEVNKDFPID